MPRGWPSSRAAADQAAALPQFANAFSQGRQQTHDALWGGGQRDRHAPVVGELHQLRKSGEFGRAKQMIADGLWDAIPHAEVVFGGHVFPLEVGHIRLAPGPFFSTVDTYDVEVRGRGGHGSMPENTIDTVVLTAAIVMRLQTVVSREVGLHDFERGLFREALEGYLDRADGLILLGYGDYTLYTHRLSQLVASDTRFVRWGSVREDNIGTTVGSDNFGAGRLAA